MRQVLIYCTDYTCGHYNIVTDDADPWPDEAAIGGLLGNRVRLLRAANEAENAAA